MDIKLKNSKYVEKIVFAAFILFCAVHTVYRYYGIGIINYTSDTAFSQNYNSSTLVTSTVIFLIIFALCGIILPILKKFDFGKNRKFNAPFELVCITGIICLIILTNAVPDIVENTASGIFAEDLSILYNLDVRVSAVAVFMLNVAAWCAGFFATYWGFACLRQVFDLGLLNYIKERTLIGSSFKTAFNAFTSNCDRLEEFLLGTDFTSRPFRKVIQAVSLNLAAVVCTGIGTLILTWFMNGGFTFYTVMYILFCIIYSAVIFTWALKFYTAVSNDYKKLIHTMDGVISGEYIQTNDDHGIFKVADEKLMHIGEGFNAAVKKEVESQRTKAELITNVSHDLKTPLTAIITYISLLEDASISEDERKKHIAVLKRKSNRLKILIEDLFEVSKASTGDITLDIKEVDIVSILKELKLEHEDRIKKSGIDFKWEFPEDRLVLKLDGQRTYRIFENLIVNIIKYGMRKTRAYIEVIKDNKSVKVCFINVSKQELNQAADMLTERFVRGDESRNTEGSGLGLAIAKSLTEIQNGKFKIIINKDLFTVELNFPTPETGGILAV